ncbi:MAG: hypothetical protein RL318_2153, partial [Fibrobacterota bacterium]
TPAPSQGNAAPRPEVKVQTPKAPSRTGWSIGASGQFQPKEVGIEESMRGGTIEGTWHVSSLPWLELGVGADLALRHRVSSVYFGNLHRIESSNSAFGMDGRVECVLKPGFGVRTRGQVGYYVPWVEKRYESEGSQQGFNAAAFAGWETGSLAIDAGIETDWSEAGPMAGMGFPSEAFLLSVRWRLR